MSKPAGNHVHRNAQPGDWIGFILLAVALPLGLSGEARPLPSTGRGAPDIAACGVVPDGGAATRQLPVSYTPTIPLAVAIDVTPYGDVRAWAEEETVPAGWHVSEITASGHWDEQANTVRWGPFFDAAPQTLWYTLTPPAGTTGSHELKGAASFDGEDVPIGGRHTLIPVPATMPLGLEQ